MIPHNTLKNRYEVKGLLHLETALHVGTGQSSATTDAAVVRDFLGRPFIPGSSLKGALRSAVEKRSEWLGLWTCYLEPDNKRCLTTRTLNAGFGTEWRQKPLASRLADIENDLCHVCKTFGSTVFGGKVQVDDLPLAEEFDPLASQMVEVRDGVGIDRDSGTAVPQVKFDYQVVPSLASFQFYLTAENLDDEGRALLSLGLLEMVSGAVPVGGKSTRGLGRCRLQIESLYQFDFSSSDRSTARERILQYLQVKPRGEEVHTDPVEFLRKQIRDFLEKGADDAQTAGQ